MLFVLLLKTRLGSTFQEGGSRRLQWQYPEGVSVAAEYWLETDSPALSRLWKRIVWLHSDR